MSVWAAGEGGMGSIVVEQMPRMIDKHACLMIREVHSSDRMTGCMYVCMRAYYLLLRGA